MPSFVQIRAQDPRSGPATPDFAPLPSDPQIHLQQNTPELTPPGASPPKPSRMSMGHPPLPPRRLLEPSGETARRPLSHAVGACDDGSGVFAAGARSSLSSLAVAMVSDL